MAENVFIYLDVDNTEFFLEEFRQKAKLALKKCGTQAVGHTVSIITEKGVVDTGNLRNSITSRLEDDHTVMVGTAVEYAIYNEMGTYKMPARPFLKPAMEDYKDEYVQILNDTLKGK